MNARVFPNPDAPLLLDGAWGTELQRLDLAAGACPDAWNIDHPDRVAGVARSYLEAGSDIILTNTFGSNAIALSRYGLEGRGEELARLGARISRAEAGDRAAVFGSIGPSGRMLLTGEVGERELADAFTAQAAALAAGGADAILIETMTDLDEALIALASARKTGLPVCVSMVFDSGPDGDCTMMGVSADRAARAFASAGADIVGANCGAGPEAFALVCARLVEACALPVWIKPNAGLPVMRGHAAVYDMPPGAFARSLADTVRAGAAYIGGCCGTTPDHIRALRGMLDAR